MTQDELISLKKLILSDQGVNFDIGLGILSNTNDAVVLYMIRCIKSEIMNIEDDLSGKYAYEEDSYSRYYKYSKDLKSRVLKLSKLSFIW